MKAGMMIAGGFLGAFGQLTGMGAAIYVIYDWNEVEPYTWMIQAFYMMVGSFYYLGTKSDFSYTEAYPYLYNRYLKSVANKQGVDFEEVEVFEEYVDRLEDQFRVLGIDIEAEIAKLALEEEKGQKKE